jgi:hypothetical protein
MKFYISAILFLTTSLTLNSGYASAQKLAGHNKLTQQEVEDGWRLLFDGETTTGWKGYNKDSFPETGWVVRNGNLVITDTDTEGGDIITNEKFENFILELEWKIPEGTGRGNSGIFFHVLEQPDKEIFWSAPEIQIIDTNPSRPAGRNQAGSLYDLVPAEPQTVRPVGEWNHVRLVINNPMIEIWQNGVRVVKIERWTLEWFDLVRESKFLGHPEFGNLRKGHIGLQDHGNHVKFRNIKIKELD